MQAAILCDNLGKSYSLRGAGSSAAYGYRTLRDDLVRWFRAPLGWLRRRRSDESRQGEDFWALRDVSFAVEPGEVLGVIGRNGSGKSTLLKILSRITNPTRGRAELQGRVGSLLEVGTGFHPELTGRENIYLNGAVLGMRRAEIARKFDRIVEFSEIGPFLDTPVKRYSSGMYVRLAFAVAAHLEPEILIVDEVLAVGDMGFQRKCLGRMREVGRAGCTVLFVSHNMPAVQSLCTRALLLDSGRCVLEGDVAELVREYHRRLLGDAGQAVTALHQRDEPGRRRKVFQSVALVDADGSPTNFVPLGGPVCVRIGLDAPEPIDYPTVTVGIDDTLGQRLLSLLTPLSRPVLPRLEGRCELECRVDHFPLAPGDYWMKLGLATAAGEIDEVERVLHFSVVTADAFGEGRGVHRGVCVAPTKWQARGSGFGVRGSDVEPATPNPESRIPNSQPRTPKP